MGFKAVLFDGYGTLFHDAMVQVASLCDRMIREQDLDMSPGELLSAWDRYWFPLIQGRDFVTLRESHVVSLTQLFEELGVSANPQTYVEEIFTRFSNSPIYDDVRPALAGLDDVRTGVVSNADADHLASALELNGLSFSAVVSSESARCYKPAPRIFHVALEGFGVSPQDALYVGDSQEDDIVGARAAGLSVAWINRREEELGDGIPEPDFAITSLTELPGIVR